MGRDWMGLCAWGWPRWELLLLLGLLQGGMGDIYVSGLQIPSALHIGCICKWELAVWVTGGESGVSRCSLLHLTESRLALIFPNLSEKLVHSLC